MAASLSRPDPSSPASVAEAGFSTARRGFSQDEVRAFLTSVAAELGRLQERERQLDAELRAAQAADAEPLELDDATLEQRLGEETLRVLHTARESASQIKIRAEENAARTIRDATDEANRLRQEAEVDAARKRQDAAADAEAEVALAKQQGREMVNEARAYRERVLSDLERRTRLARNQIDELVQGRDRLLQVFERARLVAVDVTSELSAIEGPDEVVDLSPTTGPVPLMVPAGRATDDAADVDDVQPADDVGEAGEAGEAEVADEADEVGAGDDDGGEAGTASEDEVEAPLDESEPEQPADTALADDADAVEDEAADASDGHDANVVSLFRGRGAGGDDADDADDAEVTDDAGVSDDGAAEDGPDVEGIFARLRDGAADGTGDQTVGEHERSHADDAADIDTDTDTADEDASDDEATVEPTPFSRRDEVLVPLIVAGARKIKRVLADEQNGVLDSLRQNDAVTELDAVLPAPDDHVAAYLESIHDEMLDAAAAGAGELGVNDTKTLRKKLERGKAIGAAGDHVRADLVRPLRERLARAIADGAGDNDDIAKRVRAVYREWKTQHIDDQLDDVFRFAYGGGIVGGAKPGTELIWSIDPSEPTCPDCEDNSLAGAVAAGEAFPTGHVAAPAHPGCRCLTVPADQ
ncbi:MAG: DivIVA domain-containing protein [Ilumatobacter sp.]|uniref:DivIVA domain-containing protein n=1 Tax=Ilumatobacter sp. TaxID=1967498 RepID=UPI00260E4A0B|nr:DivIVA domain-containing protein [Ilumatobacter sp.]MDJ0768673.1 DivIVA domain-containing protein [Ilumatobacter sp.]